MVNTTKNFAEDWGLAAARADFDMALELEPDNRAAKKGRAAVVDPRSGGMDIQPTDADNGENAAV